ncbi:SpoIIE family protein phosphatase [Streptomyces polygonati]|uniref:SpoIIE family protein phosphatase n=1 Tax=Streptomyces polygonati TaxID=1617087 RepID=A0ABV8HYM0_9ACTN
MSGTLELVAVISPAGLVVSWTQAAERLWGYRADEVLDRPADRLLVPGGVRGPTAPADAAGTRSGPVERVELRHRDGRGRSADLRVSPLPVGGAGHDWVVWEAGTAGPAPGYGPDTASLEKLFEHSPMGVMCCDPELRCTWHNQAITRLDLIPGGPHVGRLITELLPPERSEELAAVMRRVLDSGAPFLDPEWMPPAASGNEESALSLSVFRLDDPDGRAAGVCLMALEIGRSRSRQRWGLLVDAGTSIGTTLDVMSTAQELADTAVPALADFAAVELTDSVMPDQEPLGRLGSTEVSIPAFYRGGMASIHPDVPEALWQRGAAVFVPPASPYTAVMASRKSHFEPVMDRSPGTWRDNDPDRARIVKRFGMHSLMIVALQARGQLLGIVSFLRTRNPAPFSRADLVLAEGLAARASLSLDNARRYSRERTAALALQRDLLPHHLRPGKAVEVASRYLPADTYGGVGGDWFDVIPMRHDRVALMVGDVVGHGINAAATMGRLRMVLNTLTNLELPPDQVLTRLDELVVGLARDRPESELASPSVGATCVYVVYDPATRRCTMASAGHPPPAVVSPDGGVTFVDLPPGAPIGVGLGEFRSVETGLDEGSVIALYTDGLVETRRADIDHGLDRLRAALARPANTLEEFSTSVIDTMLADEQPEDDIALLLARTLALRPRDRS